MNDPDAQSPQEYASPACMAHEVDPVYMGLSVQAAANPEPAKPAHTGLATALQKLCRLLKR